MKTTIENVKQSKTYQLYTKLVEMGFDATIYSCFAYNYDEDNRYLSIIVRNSNDRLNELYKLASGYEVLLSQFGYEPNVSFEIRKGRGFAELINDKIWSEFCQERPNVEFEEL